jgi:release factor glutamine methyltransferase
LPEATGVGVDCKAAAVALARRNAHTHGLSNRCVFLEGDAHLLNLADFDLVLSTLPWVPTSQLDDLMPEVRLYDPTESLDGGADGLDHFRQLARSLHRLLAPQGVALVQVGYERLPHARQVFNHAGYNDVEVLRDGYGFPMALSIAQRQARPR